MRWDGKICRSSPHAQFNLYLTTQKFGECELVTKTPSVTAQKHSYGPEQATLEQSTLMGSPGNREVVSQGRILSSYRFLQPARDLPTVTAQAPKTLRHHNILKTFISILLFQFPYLRAHLDIITTLCSPSHLPDPIILEPEADTLLMSPGNPLGSTLRRFPRRSVSIATDPDPGETPGSLSRSQQSQPRQPRQPVRRVSSSLGLNTLAPPHPTPPPPPPAPPALLVTPPILPETPRTQCIQDILCEPLAAVWQVISLQV
ncbi:hypothetical protein CROQUDRAFT_99625 [Cronartium quercuum f. sp. fusiforme G11]|uniref:Uncharacterized protein n=1 Tax=Cronartium quercuum f. sp. fusiforme G11 TaxID=708437 RepID=A0A9P6N6U4_9BASI|nr:hypothetical protein CROQUDRAFT_99625 [Cronartium quercuum f. sp. fusiforme G11]